MARWVRWPALMILLVVPVAADAAKEANEEPLAPELLVARKVFVKQTLIDPRIVTRLRSELGKLDRFELVATAEEADLIATLGASVDYTETVVDSGAADDDSPTDSARGSEDGLRPMGTVRVLEDLHLVIILADGTEVWTDSVPLGSLTGNASKKLVKRLAQRLEDES